MKALPWALPFMPLPAALLIVGLCPNLPFDVSDMIIGVGAAATVLFLLLAIGSVLEAE